MSAAAIALGDQIMAAHDEARTILDHVRGDVDLTGAWLEPSEWLRALVAGVVSPSGWQRTCNHLKGSAAPQVTFLAAHRRRLECGACFARTCASVLGTEEDRRCDACRHLISIGGVQLLVTVVGATIVTVGYCTPCTPLVLGQP